VFRERFRDFDRNFEASKDFERFRQLVVSNLTGCKERIRLRPC